LKKIFFYSKKNETGDSYFKESTHIYQDIFPKKSKSQTLESVIENKKNTLLDFIKIDTQAQRWIF
jgi:type II secretory pathway component PulL